MLFDDAPEEQNSEVFRCRVRVIIVLLFAALAVGVIKSRPVEVLERWTV
jgi:hypothetical protein